MSDPVQAFYERFPYPQPAHALQQGLLDGSARAEGCPSIYSALYWPAREPRSDLDILIAGCGTTQAAMYAIACPNARFLAIDISQPSLDQSARLCRHHSITNVEHRCLAIEEIGSLGRDFDLVICVGVLPHTADPALSLRALRGVLRSDGSLFLKVYGKHARVGIYQVQEMIRRIGIVPEHADREIIAAIQTMGRALPTAHPASYLINRIRDIGFVNETADLLLHPRDRAYSVPELQTLAEGAGLVIQDWFRRARYEPACIGFPDGPLLKRAEELPAFERYAIGELFGATMHMHAVIACHSNRAAQDRVACPDDPDWASLVPVKSPDFTIDRERPQEPGRSPWLALPYFKSDRIAINLAPHEAEAFDLINEERATASILPDHGFWRRLYRYDLVAFRRVTTT